MRRGPLRALLFDKDGTLTDFHGTWDAAFGAGLRAAAHDDAHLWAAAEAVHYDLDRGVVLPGSPVIAGTNELMLELLGPHVDPVVMFEVTVASGGGRVAPAVGLLDALDSLAASRVKLGVATNDDEAIARDQLARMGIADRFECVVGADSGYGAKPDPGMVVGALELLGEVPRVAALVGDSTHDLYSARAAGAVAVLVTNGAVGAPDAVAAADIVIETLGSLVSALADHGLL